MQRYRTYGQGDDTPLNDGDTFFTGFWSRYQPTYLKPGQLYYSGNGRLDKGTYKVRKGLKSLSNDITVTNPALIVGAFSLANDKTVSGITRVSTTATVTTSTAHGYTTLDTVNIRGATQSAYNGDFSITVTDATHFTYTVAGSPATPATGTIFANKGPLVFNTYTNAVVGSGDVAFDADNTEGIVIALPAKAYLYRYGQTSLLISYPANETAAIGDPCDIVQFLNYVYMFRGYSTANELNVSSVTRVSTTATATTSASHGLSTGDWVTMVGASPNGYNGIVQVTVTGLTTFTYTVGGALTTPATGTITARPCKPPLYWDMVLTGSPAFAVVPTGPNVAGAPLINMPAVDWGDYFKGRFVLPWSRDQLVLSDEFDAGTYDPSQTQFRILPGTADWIVAAFPYQQSRILVLYRKSVHLVLLDGTSLAIAQAVEVTRNFGCVARKTVVNCGPYILWLSDLGVIRLQIGLELNLTSTTAPLSDPIQNIIDTIHWEFADKSVAAFWNNRYYLWVPTGTSEVPNTWLIYNFLNEAWESVDTYPDAFLGVNLHIISYDGSKRIHAVSTAGLVSLIEENEYDEFGTPGNVEDYQIAGSMKTRNYLAGTYDVKKVKRFQLEANVTDGDVFSGDYVLSNPDLDQPALSYTADETTDISLRASVNRRGVSGRLELATTVGRPEFKAVSVESSVTTRGTYNLT